MSSHPIFIIGLAACILLQAPVQGQELLCEVPGVCTQSLDIDDKAVPSYNECLAFCEETAGCEYFTFFADIQACLAFTECTELSETACSDCLTGQRGCPPQPEPVCDVPGWCEGYLVGLTREDSADDCLARCYLDELCLWYNFNTDDGLCVRNGNCTMFDPNRNNSITGQRECYGDQGAQQNYMFVAGGNDINGNAGIIGTSVEIVSLNSPIPCSFTPDSLPVPIVGGLSAFINDTVIICGGEQDGKVSDQCWKLDRASNTWVPAFRLSTPRAFFAGEVFVSSSQQNWWMSGGYDPDDPDNDHSPFIASTDVFREGSSASSVSIDLPIPRARHSFININDTFTFLTGGRGQKKDGRLSWFFRGDVGTFIQAQDASTDRDGEFGGLITRPDGSKAIAVVGGLRELSIEEFDLQSETWQAGPTLDREFCNGVSLPYENSFLLIGGQDRTGTGVTDEIYRFDEVNDVIELLPQRLTTARRFHMATFVPDNFCK